MKLEMHKILKKNAIGEEEDYQEYYAKIDDKLNESILEFKKENKY